MTRRLGKGPRNLDRKDWGKRPPRKVGTREGKNPFHFPGISRIWPGKFLPRERLTLCPTSWKLPDFPGVPHKGKRKEFLGGPKGPKELDPGSNWGKKGSPRNWTGDELGKRPPGNWTGEPGKRPQEIPPGGLNKQVPRKFHPEELGKKASGKLDTGVVWKTGSQEIWTQLTHRFHSLGEPHLEETLGSFPWNLLDSRGFLQI